MAALRLAALRRKGARMKKLVLSAVCLALSAVLAGCDFTVSLGGNAEELLRAPQPTQLQSAVQKALVSHLGETPQMKYPRGGEELSPIVLRDLDGDGTDEAIAFFTAERSGQNVCMAVLEQAGDSWEVVCESEGLSTEVSQVQTVSLREDAAQLVVGYANSNLTDKYLTIYSYGGGQLVMEYQQACEAFLIADLNSDGASEVYLAQSTAQAGLLTLEAVRDMAGSLQSVQTVQLNSSFLHCTALLETRSGRAQGIVVSGQLASGGTAQQVLRMTGGQLLSWPVSGGEVVTERTMGLPDALGPRITASGTVLLAHVEARADTATTTRRYYFVEWDDYLAAEPAREYGVADVATGYYLRLPSGWRDAVALQDGPFANSFVLRNEAGEALCTVRVVPEDATLGGYERLLSLEGGQKVMVYFHTNCTPGEALTLRAGALAL